MCAQWAYHVNYHTWQRNSRLISTSPNRRTDREVFSEYTERCLYYDLIIHKPSSTYSDFSLGTRAVVIVTGVIAQTFHGTGGST